MTGAGNTKTPREDDAVVPLHGPLALPPCKHGIRLRQSPSPCRSAGGAAPLCWGGRRRGAALPLQTFSFPSLAACFPPLVSSLLLSAPQRRWLRGRGASEEHRCPPGPCPVPAAALKATSPPSRRRGELACSGPTWAAQVRGREGRFLVSELTELSFTGESEKIQPPPHTTLPSYT